MTCTEDESSRVAVNCCAAWSFSTSLMATAKLCGPFPQTLVAKVCAFLSPFMNILIVAALLLNLHLLGSLLN